MSQYQRQISLNYQIATDESANQFRFVALTGSKTVALNTGAGTGGEGILQEEAIDGTDRGPKPARVAIEGSSKLKLGGVAVTAGDALTNNATGLGVAAVATNVVRAVALEDGSADAVIEVRLAQWIA